MKATRGGWKRQVWVGEASMEREVKKRHKIDRNNLKHSRGSERKTETKEGKVKKETFIFFMCQS